MMDVPRNDKAEISHEMQTSNTEHKYTINMLQETGACAIDYLAKIFVSAQSISLTATQWQDSNSTAGS
jgi:hypothetical protein